MDLSTSYLGYELAHPFMPGASPLTDSLDIVKQLEDAGAAAIVIRSLFEEQLTGRRLATHHYVEHPTDSFADAGSWLPAPADFALGPEEYQDQIRRIKESVAVPVFASLNGVTPGGWLGYARLIEEAGADALELNVYEVPTDPGEDAQVLEQRTIDVVAEVTGAVEIPVAVKLSPYHTALASTARRLVEAGARGVVLFNRFYQADIDPEKLEAVSTLRLSTPAELPLRLTWLAVLSGRVNLSLAASGGVHSALDAVKAVMAGAHVVQLVSSLLQRGPGHLRVVREEFAKWMEEHEYPTLAAMRGSMNLLRCPNPAAYERGNYLRVLQSWRGSPHPEV